MEKKSGPSDRVFCKKWLEQGFPFVGVEMRSPILG